MWWTWIRGSGGSKGEAIAVRDMVMIDVFDADEPERDDRAIQANPYPNCLRANA